MKVESSHSVNDTGDWQDFKGQFCLVSLTSSDKEKEDSRPWNPYFPRQKRDPTQLTPQAPFVLPDLDAALPKRPVR